MVCVSYRPRQPRASPVSQVLHDHAAKLPGLSREATAAIDAFLECGDLHAGFTRLHCPDCGHEFLLAFSCKGFREARKPGAPTRSNARSARVSCGRSPSWRRKPKS